MTATEALRPDLGPEPYPSGVGDLAGKAMLPLRITDAARPYLVLQQGGISDLAGSPRDWEAAYAYGLVRTLRQIAPFLPATCGRILDVGGGMGGIDAVLNARYGGDVEICILDGRSDRPVMAHHDATFSHHGVTRTFLRANGIRRFVGLDPSFHRDWAARVTELHPPPPVDLVISLQAWCFHFEPALYAHYVRDCCHADTVLILDVRDRRTDWLEQLIGPKAPFVLRAPVFKGGKSTRLALGPR